MTETPPQSSSPTIYFGFGSNLWLSQMRSRCPTSTYLGVAALPNYTWIINSRGYANVVATPTPTPTSPSTSLTAPSSTPTVYGLVFALHPTDESRLDTNEGVPHAYTKEHLPCTFWASPSPSSPVDVTAPPTERAKKMLVYIDRRRTSVGTPKAEYVYRMNRGIEDAVRLGVPGAYVEGVLRRWIPVDGGGEEGEGRREVVEMARRQAVEFVDENVGGG